MPIFMLQILGGTPIWRSDKNKIDVADGSEEFQWTLHRHIQLSNVI